MYFNELVAAYDRERRERNIFHDLMRFRVREVLLVASLYDAFILERDGVLSEQIYGEYFKLNLSTAPRISSAYTTESAVEKCKTTEFDLVILMAGLDYNQPLATAAAIREIRPDVAILLLAMNNASLGGLGSRCPSNFRNIDRVFVWNGYSKLFVGMIKYVEDLRNVDNDTRVGLVRVILLIEDSVRYYSRYMPLLYSVLMKQTQQLIEDESMVESYKILRMRGRPKILLATSYEEGLELFERYESNLLTVISDVRYSKDGVEDAEAGFKFLEMAKKRKPDLPVLIQSSESLNRAIAYEMGAAFIDKNSNSLALELSGFCLQHLGFGPFIFRDHSGLELARAFSMVDFEHTLLTIPAESLLYHASRNHFSAWLMARGEVRFARIIRNYMPDDFPDAESLRDFIVRTLKELQRGKSRGLIPDMGIPRRENGMGRIGNGSVGGKGRGLAFIKSLIDNLAFPKQQAGIDIRMPFTVFIGIDEFERFMDLNQLWQQAKELDGLELRRSFVEKRLDDALINRLRDFVYHCTNPIAVRSSGLFEDMLMVPFAGVYDTFLLPNSHPDPEVRLDQLRTAIKLVYASLFTETALAYFNAAHYKRDEERMAVVLQEVVGCRQGRWFYPLISGTAQSYNYYPVSYLKPEDGLCTAALGLGPYVVEGGQAWQFSPRYPKVDVLSTEHRMSGSQRWFYAIDMEKTDFNLVDGENATLEKLDIVEAEKHPRFSLIASTWNMADNRLEPGTSARGPRVIDFAPILKYEAFPFAKVVEAALEVASRSMGVPVEIEYAIDYCPDSGDPVFYLLQIKPLIQNSEKVAISLSDVDRADCLLLTEHCMGNGRFTGIQDIVYVDPERFDRAATEDIAREVGELNAKLQAEKRSYILIGPGRWGTRDRWLGIPVSFAQISAVKAIVEADLADFSVESSLGSHFFHNVTSMNIGYFSVPFGKQSSFVDWAALKSEAQQYLGKYCCHVRTDLFYEVVMDGMKGHGLIKKPGTALTPVVDIETGYCD